MLNAPSPDRKKVGLLLVRNKNEFKQDSIIRKPARIERKKIQTV
jgi:hypothetical protein